MADEQSKWSDVADGLTGFGERMTGDDRSPADRANEEALNQELEDSDSSRLQEDLAADPTEPADSNRPQFGEQIQPEDERLMAEHPNEDEDYQRPMM